MAEVILRKDMRGLGRVGDIVKVKDGYARNFLIPKGVAYLATKENLKVWEEEKRRISKEMESRIEKAKEEAAKLEGISVNIVADANDEDVLYGSVNEQQIQAALKEDGFEVDKDAIVIHGQIKKLGIYDVDVVLRPEAKASIKVWVVRK